MKTKIHRIRFNSFVWCSILGISLLCGCIARSEKDVVVYSALDEEFASPILDAFQRSVEGKTRVLPKFDIESTKTVGLANLIIDQSNSPVCDVFWNNEILHTVRLQKAGLLEPRRWEIPPGHPPDLRAADGTWFGFAARARVLIVNTDLVKPGDFPKSVEDLASPKWKDQCAIARPLFGTTATHFAVLRDIQGEGETLNLLKQIRSNARVLSGNKQVALSVSAGSIAWGLTDTDDAFIEKDSGYPVEIIFPDQSPTGLGTLRIPNTIAVIRGAPHPVAAGQLADFLIRPETEDRLAMGNSSQMPLSSAAKFPPPVLPKEKVRWMRADLEAAAEGWPEWAKKLEEMFP
ncbi:MAG: extracellular solute-binding protein [Planctomycetota bacterium]